MTIYKVLYPVFDPCARVARVNFSICNQNLVLIIIRFLLYEKSVSDKIDDHG